MKGSILIVLYVILGNVLNAQNLIPNPSFEEVIIVDSFFSRNYKAFNAKIEGWTSPTQSSPDIIHEPYIETMCADGTNRVRKNFDIKPLKPRTGKVFAGIKVFGCDRHNTHCREYLQIKTKKPMQRGKCYEFSYFTNPLTNGSRINKMGVAFSYKIVNDIELDGVLELSNRFGENDIITPGPGNWQEVKGTIKAKDDWNYMIIGNFFYDYETEEIPNKTGYRWGYYLVDDVSLVEIDCKTEKPIFKQNSIVVYFDSNKSMVSAEQKAELQNFLRDVEYDKSRLEIIGHADEDGNEEFNQQLSLKRANAVKKILVETGINSESVVIRAMGEKAPISKNEKQKNRRVVVRTLDI